MSTTMFELKPISRFKSDIYQDTYRVQRNAYTNPPPPPLTTTTFSPTSRNISNLGLGYAIVIALAFLALFSILLLSFYICCRRNHHPPPQPSNPDNAIYLPRILFVAEDDEENQNSTPIGLNQSIINSYPRFIYSKKLGNNATSTNVRDDTNVTNETTCPICLCEYTDSEMLRMLPDCRHYFHVTCVDAWLKLNGSCPVCRNSPLPTPLSTPLSEVVPLSQYSDGRRRV